MKQLILLALLISCTGDTWAQNSFRQATPYEPVPNDPFDLNKFVWSHTNYKSGKGDKPVMDFRAVENDISIGQELAISPDGKYFAWSIQNTMHGRHDTLVIQATMGAWRQAFTSASPGFFSADSKLYVFQDKEDLCFLQLGNGRMRTVKEIATYQRPGGDRGQWLAYQLKDKQATLVLQDLLNGTEKRFERVARYGFDTRYGMQRKPVWLAYQLNNDAKELVIYHLATGKERRFQSAVNYSFDVAGQVLVLKTTEKTNEGIRTALQYVNLPDGSSKTIWHTLDSTTSISRYTMDGSGKQVVLVVQEAGKADAQNQPSYSIWYYREGMEKVVLKVNNMTQGIESPYVLAGAASFSDNDRHIFVNLQHRQTGQPTPDPNAVKLDVWSYKDTNLQSTQPYLLQFEQARPPLYTAVIPVEGGQLIRLNRENETMKVTKGDFAIIGKRGGKNAFLQPGFMGDRFWEAAYQQDSNWLVSLKDGNRRLLKTKGPQLNDFWSSPEGRYLVYSDAEKQCNYFSIDLATGKLANISAEIPAWQLGMEDFYLRPRQNPSEMAGIAAWLAGDAGLLVYDNYDIWQLDLAGKKSPINLTNGYGRKSQIQLRLADYINAFSIKPVLESTAVLLLQAFNTQNKFNGFYKKALGSSGNPELLYMGPCLMKNAGQGMDPLKASDANVWIVKRQTATQAPNYFLTSDFKTYRPLTDLQPQKAYNWLTAELHSFKQLDGTISQGVLYKPENFDPAKKYPVIIAFYSTLSERVHIYPAPELMSSPSTPMNSPGWLVSHGYLVFTPDTYFKKGQWGPSTLNTVEGAARYMSSLSFVDNKRLGACGHSNGGRFAAYVLTHSKTFAAMSIGEGFGFANVINTSLSLDNQTSNLEWAENDALGGGLGSLWENKATWLDHSAVLNANKVKSPLLIFCKFKEVKTLGSGDVKIEQTIQLFTALRRLKKEAWWLGYNDAGHVVRLINDQKDFTIRYTQFFDHYLKGAPAPKWMTQGIPAKYKQIESRYELDPEGSCGNDCSVCRQIKTSK